VQQVIEEVGAKDVPLLEVYNKIDRLDADERRRLQARDPSALYVSATTGDGLEELIETVTSRLALDIRRITLTLNPDDPADRERIARIYRHARVVVHETRDAEVTIVADVPRRLLDRLAARRR
jgi:GTPase